MPAENGPVTASSSAHRLAPVLCACSTKHGFLDLHLGWCHGVRTAKAVPTRRGSLDILARNTPVPAGRALGGTRAGLCALAPHERPSQGHAVGTSLRLKRHRAG